MSQRSKRGKFLLPREKANETETLVLHESFSSESAPDFRETYTIREGRVCKTLRRHNLYLFFLLGDDRPSICNYATAERPTLISFRTTQPVKTLADNARGLYVCYSPATRTEDRIFTARREQSGKTLLPCFEEIATNSPALYFHPLFLSLSLSLSLSLKRTRYFRQEVDFLPGILQVDKLENTVCSSSAMADRSISLPTSARFSVRFCFIPICLTNWPTFSILRETQRNFPAFHRSEGDAFLKQPCRMEESTEE